MQQHIDRDKLYTDGAYRFQYVTNFMDFGMYQVHASHAVIKFTHLHVVCM